MKIFEIIAFDLSLMHWINIFLNIFAFNRLFLLDRLQSFHLEHKGKFLPSRTKPNPKRLKLQPIQMLFILLKSTNSHYLLTIFVHNHVFPLSYN